MRINRERERREMGRICLLVSNGDSLFDSQVQSSAAVEVVAIRTRRKRRRMRSQKAPFEERSQIRGAYSQSACGLWVKVVLS